MKLHPFAKTLIVGAFSSPVVLVAPQALGGDLGDKINELKIQGSYLTGDKHNHTTCTGGSTSVKMLVDQSTMRYGLDWFSQSGHGGSYPRDCRFSDPNYSVAIGDVVWNRQNELGEGAFYVDTIRAGAIKGDYVDTTFTVWDDPATPERERVREMWRWQSIQDFNYEELSSSARQSGKPVWQGLEWIVPGHEHTSMAVLDGQFPGLGLIGNADAVAQFEYLFDRADDDMSAGGGQGWTGKIPNVAGDHAKSVAGIEWLADNLADNIPCPFQVADAEEGEFVPAACPEHLPMNEALGVKVVDADVESWADLWFYSNPIFIELVD